MDTCRLNRAGAGAARAVPSSSRSVQRQPPETVYSGGGAPDLDTPAWNTLFVAPGQRRRARLCAAARAPLCFRQDDTIVVLFKCLLLKKIRN